VSPLVRGKLRDLAELCGLSNVMAETANDADLISIYLVAIKDPRAGERVAGRIAARLGDPLGFPEPLAEPMAPTRVRRGSPFPPIDEPAPVPPGLSEARVREIAHGEVQRVLPPLQQALDKMGREHTEA